MLHRIREIHTDSRGAYGARRITLKLHHQGHAVNHKRALLGEFNRERLDSTIGHITPYQARTR